MRAPSRARKWLLAAAVACLIETVINTILAVRGVPYFPVRYLLDVAGVALLVGCVIAVVLTRRLDRWSGIGLSAASVILLVLQLAATSEVYWPFGNAFQTNADFAARFILQPVADAVLTLAAFSLVYFYLVAWEKMTEARQRAASERELQLGREQLLASIDTRADELADANRRLQLEIDQRARIEVDLLKKQRSLEELIAAHDRDRQLLVYEIHDGLVQNLTGALFHFEAARQIQSPAPPAADQQSVAMQLLREAIDEARGLLSGLRPPILDEQGLVAGLEYLIAEHHQQGGASVTFQAQVSGPNISHVVEGIAYRIAQEALHNVRRHSQARQVEITLSQLGDRLHLEIRDDGVGFDLERASAAQRLGLRGIRERAAALHGTAVIESAPGRGTRVHVDMPAVDTLEREIEQRRAAEQALAESERMYRLLADHSSDVISRHSADGTILYISPACRAMFGYEPQEMIGTSPFELLHPDDRAQIADYVSNAAVQGDFFTFIYRTRAKAGHYRWLETIGRRISDPATGMTIEFVTNSREITRRREAEIELRASEERFRTLIDAMPFGLYMSEGPAGHLVYANQAAMDIWEVTAKTFNPYIWHQSVHPDDRARVLAEVQRTVAAGIPFTGEFRAIGTVTRRERWVRVAASFVTNESGGRTRRVGMIEDITERKLADEARQAIETRHRQLVQALPDMTLRVRRDGTYVDFEPGEDIEPVRPFDMLRGRKVSDVLPADEARAVLASIERALASGHSQTTRHVIPFGNSTRDCEARIAPAGNDEAFIFVRDVSIQAAEERRLRDTLTYLHAACAQAGVIFAELTEAGPPRLLSGDLRQLLGTADSEACFERWLAAVVDDDRPSVLASWNPAATNGSTELVYRVNRADGGTRSIRQRKFHVAGSQGRPHLTIVSLEDDTARP